MSIESGADDAPLFVAPNATVLGNVTLAPGVSIWFGAVLRADKDRIAVGEGSNIQDNVVIHTSRNYPVVIGKEVSVGHGAILHGCEIHDHVLIGMGAIAMNGAVIGERSILGAGTVITEGTLIAAESVVLGVPGKVVKQTSVVQHQYIIENARSYIELAKRYRDT